MEKLLSLDQQIDKCIDLLIYPVGYHPNLDIEINTIRFNSNYCGMPSPFGNINFIKLKQQIEDLKGQPFKSPDSRWNDDTKQELLFHLEELVLLNV
jgi:hypothetical protein